mmetsp:Transcript_1141/g.2393  ORF Transcript_1141/g.2393 Transcript_1141/m.2393 type:complete len:351 (-) Transcript_1141:1187-2239(-)
MCSWRENFDPSLQSCSHQQLTPLLNAILLDIVKASSFNWHLNFGTHMRPFCPLFGEESQSLSLSGARTGFVCPLCRMRTCTTSPSTSACPCTRARAGPPPAEPDSSPLPPPSLLDCPLVLLEGLSDFEEESGSLSLSGGTTGFVCPLCQIRTFTTCLSISASPCTRACAGPPPMEFDSSPPPPSSLLTCPLVLLEGLASSPPTSSIFDLSPLGVCHSSAFARGVQACCTPSPAATAFVSPPFRLAFPRRPCPECNLRRISHLPLFDVSLSLNTLGTKWRFMSPFLPPFFVYLHISPVCFLFLQYQLLLLQFDHHFPTPISLLKTSSSSRKRPIDPLPLPHCSVHTRNVIL